MSESILVREINDILHEAGLPIDVRTLAGGGIVVAFKNKLILSPKERGSKKVQYGIMRIIDFQMTETNGRPTITLYTREINTPLDGYYDQEIVYDKDRPLEQGGSGWYWPKNEDDPDDYPGIVEFEIV